VGSPLWDGEAEGLIRFACSAKNASRPGRELYRGYFPEKMPYFVDTGAYLCLPRLFVPGDQSSAFYVQSADFDYHHPIPQRRFKSPASQPNPSLVKIGELPEAVKVALQVGLAYTAASLGIGVDALLQIVAGATTIAQVVSNLSAAGVAGAETAVNTITTAMGGIVGGAAASGYGIPFAAASAAVLGVLFGLASAVPALGESEAPDYLWAYPSLLYTPVLGGDGFSVNWLDRSADSPTEGLQIDSPMDPHHMAGPDEVTRESWFAGLVKLAWFPPPGEKEVTAYNGVSRFAWLRRASSENILAFNASVANGAGIFDSLGAVTATDNFAIEDVRLAHQVNESWAREALSGPFAKAMRDKLGVGAEEFLRGMGQAAGLAPEWKPGSQLHLNADVHHVVLSGNDQTVKMAADQALQGFVESSLAGLPMPTRAGRVYGASPSAGDDPPYSDETILVYTPSMIVAYATWLDQRVIAMDAWYASLRTPEKYVADGGALFHKTDVWAASVPPQGWDQWSLAFQAWYFQLVNNAVTQATATWDEVKTKHSQLRQAAESARAAGLPSVPSAGNLPKSAEDRVSSAVDTLVTGALVIGGVYLGAQFLASRKA
jgi:hypothetical protein